MKRWTYLLIGLFTMLMVSCSTAIHSSRPEPVTASPIAASSTAIIASGNFVSGEHPTKGSVRIVNLNGKRVLQLDRQFETSTSGPDLVVVLHRSANVIQQSKPPAYPLQKGSYLEIAPLRQYNGEQSYEIPQNVNLNDFKSAAIWCRRFNATFGAATLQS